MISFGHFCIICHYIGQGLCEPTMHLYKYCTILATEAKNKKDVMHLATLLFLYAVCYTVKLKNTKPTTAQTTVRKKSVTEAITMNIVRHA